MCIVCLKFRLLHLTSRYYLYLILNFKIKKLFWKRELFNKTHISVTKINLLIYSDISLVKIMK